MEIKVNSEGMSVSIIKHDGDNYLIDGELFVRKKKEEEKKPLDIGALEVGTVMDLGPGVDGGKHLIRFAMVVSKHNIQNMDRIPSENGRLLMYLTGDGGFVDMYFDEFKRDAKVLGHITNLIKKARGE